MTAAPQPSLNVKALAWTVGTHILILLLLLLVGFNFQPREQPVEELGMEVNLGTSDNGSGTDQPMEMDDPAEEAAVVPRHNAAQEEDALRDMERSDDNDAPEVPPTRATHVTGTTPRETTPRTTRPVRQEAPTNTPAPVRPVEQRPKYVMTGGSGRGGNGALSNAPGSSEGNTFGNGDRGVPHGTPGATNYTGSPGTGTGGISHSLSGRNIVAFPPREAEFREGGKVVIRVTVNRAGSIVNQTVISATSAELRPIALRKLQQVKFNRSETAPEEQFGNITFVFKTRS